ncbi:MAG TPA: C2H2-type zinc finger protein [Thermoplasmata archaeon]|jgi:hypothetical protein|nr:C2H2-type zinc finger protein [Thermoplasmata archaeon]
MPYVEYDEVEAICPACGRLFRSPDDLERHREESHAGLGPEPPATPPSHVVCPVCGSPFDSAEAARVHRRRAHRG